MQNQLSFFNQLAAGHIKEHPVYKNYWISKSGVVFSTKVNRMNSHGIPRLLSTRVDTRGYLVANIDRHPRSVHRLVLEAHRGCAPMGHECCHGDGNKLNNDITNLRWDTRSNNHLDAVRHGTACGLKNHGQNNGAAKLSEEDVKNIKNEYKKGQYGFGARILAKKYGVSPKHILNIINGVKWKHA